MAAVKYIQCYGSQMVQMGMLAVWLVYSFCVCVCGCVCVWGGVCAPVCAPVCLNTESATCTVSQSVCTVSAN